MTTVIAAAAPTAGSRLWVQWTLSNRGCPTIVSFAGEIDAANAGGLVDTLDAVLGACTDRLVIDLSAVDFVDDAGVMALLRARRHAQARSLNLDIVCSANVPRRLLSVAADDEQLDLFDSLAGAIRARSAPGSKEHVPAGT